MELSRISTKRFLVDPKKKNFIEALIKISPVFDINIPRVSKKKSLVYMTLMYDVNSELQNIKEVKRRSYTAAETAGFVTDKDGRFSEEVLSMLIGRCAIFNKAMIEYVSRTSNPLWKHRVVTEFQYNRLADESVDPQKGFDKDTFKLLDDLRKKIGELDEQIFNGQTLPDIKKSFYDGLAKSVDSLRMEAVNETYAENGLVEWTPYPNYTHRKVKFVADEIPE